MFTTYSTNDYDGLLSLDVQFDSEIMNEFEMTLIVKGGMLWR